jgi:REP element-mobilizing transposase RayT
MMSDRKLDYDFSLPGFYMVTICTSYRRSLFGKILDDQPHLNEAGQIAKSTWNTLPQRFPHVRLDEYVFMPNHMHGIVELTDLDLPVRASLREIIRSFKAATCLAIRRSKGKPWFAWEAGFYKSVLDTENMLNIKRGYIINNPLRWRADTLYRPY